MAWVLPAMPRDPADPLVSYWGPMARAVAETVTLDVVALRFPSALPTFAWGRARIHTLPHGHLRRRASPKIWHAALRRLGDLHRRRPIRLLHALHGNEAGWVSVLASLHLRLPLVVHLGGGETVGLPRLGYGSRCHAMERWQVAASLRRARWVTVGSTYQGQLAVRRWGVDPSRVLELPVGLDLAPYDPRRRPPQRPDLGTDQEAPRTLRLISVAELNAVKGHDLVLQAVAPWLHSIPGLRLALVGGGPRLAALRRLAETLGVAAKLEWHGQVPNPGLAARLARAQVFVHGSHHEAQGLALIEAAAAGLQIASTAVGVAPQLGLPAVQLAAPGDLCGLRAAVGHAIAAALGKPTRGGSAALPAAEAYALEPVAARWQQRYAAMTAGRA